MAKNAESANNCEFMTWKTFQRNDTLQEQTFMVRKQYVEMIQYLKQINWPEQDLTKFILWGKKGTGKTLTLSQIFHFAHKSNFIVIHLPKLKHWFRQYTGVSFKYCILFEFNFNHFTFLKKPTKSEYKTGRWNLPNETIIALEYFKHFNQDKLEGLVTHKTYKWSEM